MSAANLLEVRDLRVSFFTSAGEVRAVNGISYNIKPGEVMGIVGESGSGKSVEAYSVMGLLEEPGKIVGGSIVFEGQDVRSFNQKQLEQLRGNRMSMIFQNPMESLNPVYTIGNQLEEVYRSDSPNISRSAAKARAVEMLDLVGITDPARRVKQYPYELSGGMRQRVMIAMGLICEPRLLIADEPTTALDVTIQAQILELMKTIREKTGMAIIFITHNLAAIAEICDSVSVMYGGYMVEQGSVDDIFYQPLHPYTRGLLRSMPRIDEEQADRLIPIEGSPVNMVGSIPGCPFAPRCEQCMKVCVRAMPPRTVAEAGTPSGDGVREGSGYQGPSDEALSHEVSCWLTRKGALYA